MTKLHAHFDGRVLIPDEPVDLPQGRTLEVEVREIASHGSARAILNAMKEPPVISEVTAAELETAIQSGKLPLSQPFVFEKE